MVWNSWSSWNSTSLCHNDRQAPWRSTEMFFYAENVSSQAWYSCESIIIYLNNTNAAKWYVQGNIKYILKCFNFVILD